jgi:ABC-type transport system involved in cytochrome bd biosynthesis fused ATPase/permease subunit
MSKGMQQRLGIAQALVGAPRLLMLDEPTSALDAHNERIVQETLISFKGKRTIVLVSHRISTVMGCDRIYVLHQGTIVEQGSHDELMRHGGFYAGMAKQQLKPDFPVFPRAAYNGRRKSASSSKIAAYEVVQTTGVVNPRPSYHPKL